ncbi:MAG: hypothetical protein CMK59_03730 [Proteobacteria bacterium]|nr:hypothetical protein [Pseudomonadota bacterium]
MRVKPFVVAHRGAHAGQRSLENTLVAFQRAIDAGYDCIETDLRLTKDKTWICCHDPQIAGLSVAKTSFFQLRAAAEQMGIVICSLEECLSLHSRIHLDLEIKVPGYEEHLWSILSSIPIEHYVIKSFHRSCLLSLRELSVDVRLGILWTRRKWLSLFKSVPRDSEKQVLQAFISEIKPQFISLELSAVDAMVFELIRNVGVELWPWTVRSKEQTRALIDLGVEAVVTDVPEYVASLTASS